MTMKENTFGSLLRRPGETQDEAAKRISKTLNHAANKQGIAKQEPERDADDRTDKD